MGKFVDLTGHRFGRLIVLERAEDGKCGRSVRARYLCKCDCGNIKNVAADHLRSGEVASCGCLKRELMIAGKAKEMSAKSHQNRPPAQTKTRLYRIWNAMKQRCSNPNTIRYRSYGGKGIKVCEEWLNDFASFKDWALSHGYADNLTIDRIDVNGNYCPENCRWTTPKVQANNTSKNRYIEYHGKNLTIAEAADRCNIPYNTLLARIDRYKWPIEKAIETPVMKK